MLWPTIIIRIQIKIEIKLMLFVAALFLCLFVGQSVNYVLLRLMLVKSVLRDGHKTHSISFIGTR